jgi:hypothetical protein
VLNHITPVLLTHNEEQNIGRTLSRLSWAQDIIVVHSGSTDGTLNLLVALSPKTILLRKGKFNVRGGGHTDQWDVEGAIRRSAAGSFMTTGSQPRNGANALHATRVRLDSPEWGRTDCLAPPKTTPHADYSLCLHASWQGTYL